MCKCPRAGRTRQSRKQRRSWILWFTGKLQDFMPPSTAHTVTLLVNPSMHGTDNAVQCHVFQGSRGFPGTPGPPGLKGHRVSISFLKQLWTCCWVLSFNMCSSALTWLSFTIFTFENLCIKVNWLCFALFLLFCYSFSACLLTNTCTPLESLLTVAFANRATADQLAKKVKLELLDPRYK